MDVIFNGLTQSVTQNDAGLYRLTDVATLWTMSGGKGGDLSLWFKSDDAANADFRLFKSVARFANGGGIWGNEDALLAYSMHCSPTLFVAIVDTLNEQGEIMQLATMAINFNDTNYIIRQNEDGMYSMNDLHAASGGAKKSQPSDWLRLKGTAALVEELEKSTPGIPGVVTINGGSSVGSWIHEALVPSYAGWISPAFQLSVNKAFIALAKGDTIGAQAIVDNSMSIIARETLRTGNTRIRDAISLSQRAGILRGTEEQANINVRSLVTEIVTGINAKTFNKPTSYGMSSREFLLMHNDTARLMRMVEVEAQVELLLKIGRDYQQVREQYIDEIKAARDNWNY